MIFFKYATCTKTVVLQGDTLSSGQLQSCIEPGLEGNVGWYEEIIGPIEIMNGSFCYRLQENITEHDYRSPEIVSLRGKACHLHSGSTGFESRLGHVFLT
jgi:hypothetical protein